MPLTGDIIGPICSSTEGRRSTTDSLTRPSTTRPSCCCFFIDGLLFQGFYFVTKLGSFFELKHLGRFAHFGFELGDQRLRRSGVNSSSSSASPSKGTVM